THRPQMHVRLIALPLRCSLNLKTICIYTFTSKTIFCFRKQLRCSKTHKKMKNLLMIFAVLFFGACTNSSENNGTSHAHESVHHNSEAHDEHSGAIELNDGSKWKADPE